MKEDKENEIKEFLLSGGYFKKIEDLKKKRTTSFGIKMVIALEIVPEVAQKTGKDPKKIKDLINKILT